MANGTLVAAQTLNGSTQAMDVGTATAAFFTVLLPELFRRFFVFVAAPFLYPEMWWLLIHLVLTFILFEFYFERHKDEELGWSAALANSIVMIFISMELLRSLYHHEGSPFSVLWNVITDYSSLGIFSDQMIMITLVILLGIIGILTAIINYFHFLPRKIAFLISGHKTVNLLAYFLIVLVWRFTHGNPIPIDGLTVTALIMFGAMMWSLFFFMNNRIKKVKEKVSIFS